MSAMLDFLNYLFKNISGVMNGPGGIAIAAVHYIEGRDNLLRANDN